MGTLSPVALYCLFMSRLNDRAYRILSAEVQKCTEDNVLQQVQRDVVLKRLAKLRSAKGVPASLEELRQTVSDFPNLSEKALKSAATANRSPGTLGMTWAAIVLFGLGGMLWLVNLPDPMIRWSVVQTTPILLLPSYISMDYHYRQAVARVEQAEQQIDRATNLADMTLGEMKIQQAQQHLDAIPVWFLGYSPQYTFWFGWQFTVDEFYSAKANIGRMEAKVFQEKKAQTQLDTGKKALVAAKQQYQQSKTGRDRKRAIASWQAALVRIEQVPRQTLAGQTARTKLVALKRDFEQVAGAIAQSARTNMIIVAAQQYAFAAGEAAQNLPHTASQWREIAGLWQEAIAQVEKVGEDDPSYTNAQKLLVKYQINLGKVRSGLQTEQESVAALNQAKDRIFTLLASNDSSLKHHQQLVAQLQDIIDLLEQAQPKTTAYAEAQRLLKLAETKLQLQPK